MALKWYTKLSYQTIAHTSDQINHKLNEFLANICGRSQHSNYFTNTRRVMVHGSSVYCFTVRQNRLSIVGQPDKYLPSGARATA